MFVVFVDRRLKACEECFERSYGKNLERLAAVKVRVSASFFYVPLHTVMNRILEFFLVSHSVSSESECSKI